MLPPHHNKMEEVHRKKVELIEAASCGAFTAAVEKYVWMWSRNSEWRDCDVMHLTDTDFLH